jgi:hypothetical protein
LVSFSKSVKARTIANYCKIPISVIEARPPFPVNERYRLFTSIDFPNSPSFTTCAEHQTAGMGV